jgi:hypothetical protein
MLNIDVPRGNTDAMGREGECATINLLRAGRERSWMVNHMPCHPPQLWLARLDSQTRNQDNGLGKKKVFLPPLGRTTKFMRYFPSCCFFREYFSFNEVVVVWEKRRGSGDLICAWVGRGVTSSQGGGG